MDPRTPMNEELHSAERSAEHVAVPATSLVEQYQYAQLPIHPSWESPGESAMSDFFLQHPDVRTELRSLYRRNETIRRTIDQKVDAEILQDARFAPILTLLSNIPLERANPLSGLLRPERHDFHFELGTAADSLATREQLEQHFERRASHWLERIDRIKEVQPAIVQDVMWLIARPVITDNERDVLSRSFGLTTGVKETQAAIAADKGVVQQRIQTLKSKGLEKLAEAGAGHIIQGIQAFWNSDQHDYASPFAALEGGSTGLALTAQLDRIDPYWPTWAASLTAEQVRERMENVLQAMAPQYDRGTDLLRRVYGLNGDLPVSIEQATEEIGLTRKRTGHLLTQALKGFRQGLRTTLE
jgi:hypothetical protein